MEEDVAIVVDRERVPIDSELKFQSFDHFLCDFISISIPIEYTYSDTDTYPNTDGRLNTYTNAKTDKDTNDNIDNKNNICQKT